MLRPARGFTLIELIVVVAIIAIMLALAVPSFATFISSYRATSAINDLLQAVTQTRIEALKRGRSVTLAPVGSDWRQGWTVFVRASTNPTQAYNAATDELVYKHGVLPSSISVTGVGTNAAVPFNGLNYVIFDGTGYPRTSTGASISSSGSGIAFTNTGPTASSTYVKTLCLGIIGRVRIVAPAPPTPPAQADPCTSG